MSTPRILILRGGAIGDFVLTLPAMQALRARWPGAYIEVIGYPWVAELAVAGGIVDSVVSLDRAEVARYFAFRAELSAEQKDYLRSFHFIISYLHDPAGTVRDNMAAAGAQQFIYGSPLVESGHAVEHLIKPLEELAVYPETQCRPVLMLPEERRQRGAARIAGIGENVVAIHPGSGSPKKNWPPERFLAVARIVADHGLAPLLIVGPAEVELDRELTGTGCEIPVVRGYSIMELAEALSACAGYVGNDSGVTHIAAALGVPVVALFGPSDAQTWAPRGEHVRVMTADERSFRGLLELEVDSVADALLALIDEGRAEEQV